MPDNDDSLGSAGWSAASLVTATLFMNWSFTTQLHVPWPFSPLPLYMLILCVFAVLLTGLFFIGPALATRAAGRSLFAVVEQSLGSIPAYGVRLSSAAFLLLWMASLIHVPMTLLSINLGRRTSAVELGVGGAVAVFFVLITGQQSLKTNARLAIFTNKLCLAILIAALIRVREGWAAILDPLSMDDRGWFWYAWADFSMLALYVAPLAFLAANVGRRGEGRKEIAFVGLAGLALPILVALFLVGAIQAATHSSGYYQPSLQPSVSMALWSKAARSALPGRILIAAVSVFGALRFGGASLIEAVPIRAGGHVRRWILTACFAVAVAWCSMNAFEPAFFTALEFTACCVAVAGGVITIDLVIGRRCTERARKVDWVGLTACVVGLSMPLYVPHGPMELTRFPWWFPWLLPAFVMTFLVSLVGRLAQKILAPAPFQADKQVGPGAV